MISYPANYPQADFGTYSGTIDVGLVRTSVPNADASQLRNYNAPTTEISMSFSMTNDTYQTWLTWVLANAYRYFTMPVVSSATPTDITSVQRVRFISPIEYQKAGDDWGTATVAAEIVAGDFHL